MKQILFIDRDGTLIKESPPTYQIDSENKLEFYREVSQHIAGLTDKLKRSLCKFEKNNFMPVEYITTDKGNKTKVVIPLSDYKKLIAKAEELDEIKAYDRAKKEDDGKRIPLDKLLKKYSGNK